MIKEDLLALQIKIRDIDYDEFVSLLGTAHFTRRSVREAYEAVERLKPSDLAIELDLRRFNVLNGVCALCPKRSRCDRKCEFVGATDALGNADANIWLIDMSEYEIAVRIRSAAYPFSSGGWGYISYADVPFFYDSEKMMKKMRLAFGREGSKKEY